MRRSAVPRQAAGFSLFSFLDALLCTMGALILVLVVIVRQLETHYDDVAADKIAHSGDRQAELELIELRISQLQEQRARTEEDLRKRRLELGHVEEHSRALADRIAEIEATLVSLAQGSRDDPQRREAHAKVDQLRARARELQSRLADARDAAAANREAYAIIPYEGPNETRRRPIYIECRADAILLQPEGIRLSESDFQGPLGPGNPLAAALRAAREHISTTTDVDAADREPYPLLLVRPSGIVAYYVALQSLKSWHSEFGYELVEEDWELSFPTRDVELARVEQRAVDNARDQLQRLAMAVPLTYGRDTRPSFAPPTEAEQGFYGGGAGGRGPGARFGPGVGGSGGRAYPYGGNQQRERGSSDYAGNSPGGSDGSPGAGDGSYGGGEGGGAFGYPDQQPLPAEARGGMPQGRATAADLDEIYGSAAVAANGGLPGGAGGSPQGDSSLQGSGEAGDRVFGEQLARERGGTGPSGDGSSGSLAGQPGASRDRRGGNGASGSAQGGPSGSASSETSAGSSAQGSSNQSASAQPGSGATGEQQSPFSRRGEYRGATPTKTAANGSPGGGSSSHGDASGASAQGGQASAGSPGSGGSSSGQEQGMPSATAHVGARDSMASKRGENWGVPPKAPEAVAITRPIRVRCSANRLELIAENNRTVEGRAIVLGKWTENSVDELVGRVWRRMEGWGMAGKNLYWHPVLQLEVMPDGAARAEDLKILLAGSGLDISEKSVVAPVATRPPVNGRR